MERPCYRCGTPVASVERIGRRDVCLRCGSDLHCCRNCSFYDAAYHNQCREPQAERQVDKEAGNFCEFFAFRTGARASGLSRADAVAKARLEALFRKPK
jgi:hypothetical protein